jgi:hypothetical protein
VFHLAGHFYDLAENVLKLGFLPALVASSTGVNGFDQCILDVVCSSGPMRI